MRLNLIRKIDYFIGRPICFFLSLIENMKKCFYADIVTKTQIRKIIFLELSEMGSAILAYSAIRRIKERYPNASVYFWIFKENSKVLDLFSSIIHKENIIFMRSENIIVLLIDVIKNIKKIRRYKIDTIVDMELFSRFSSILSYLSGARVRVGFYRYNLEGLYRGKLHTCRVMYNPYLHISKNFISLIDSLQSSLDNIPILKSPQRDNNYYLPKININNQDREQLWEKLRALRGFINEKRTIIVINFNSSDKLGIRIWPLVNYAELIQRICEKTSAIIVLIGADPINVMPFFSKYERIINLTGKTTINELICLFDISTIFISHDGGIVHIASLTDIYIIALFGPETPLLYEPLTKNKKIFYKQFACSPCLSAYNHRNSICKDNQCMKAISVDEVYEEVLQIINKKNKENILTRDF